MKKIFALITIGLFIAYPAFTQEGSFAIKIIQDSVQIPDANNVVILKKTAFKIQVELNGLDGVYLYAAFKDSIYKIETGEAIPGFKDIPPMCMAEESFNPDQELLISDEGWSYWFYDPKEDWHRFDKEIQVTEKAVTATKTIKQFYLVEAEKALVIENVDEPLYLFFMSAMENRKHALAKELQRLKIKVNWK